MITDLFVIANVRRLRTDASFRILLPFFRTSWDVGFLNSAIFNSFHNRVEFSTILEGLRNFGGGGGVYPPPPSHCVPDNFDVCVCEYIYLCVCVLFADYNSSKLFGDAPKDILDILVSQNVTVNFHHFCVTEAVSDVIFLENKIMEIQPLKHPGDQPTRIRQQIATAASEVQTRNVTCW